MFKILFVYKIKKNIKNVLLEKLGKEINSSKINKKKVLKSWESFPFSMWKRKVSSPSRKWLSVAFSPNKGYKSSHLVRGESAILWKSNWKYQYLFSFPTSHKFLGIFTGMENNLLSK